MKSPLFALSLVLSCSDHELGVYDTPPTASIVDPPDASTRDEGTVVLFEGHVDDDQDDSPSLLVSLASDLDGTLSDDLVADALGHVTYGTANLSPGNHAITLTVIDGSGQSADDTVGITVEDLPDKPTVAIASPVPGEHGNEGEPFAFRALVSDAQDPPEKIEVTFASDQSDGTFCDELADITGLAQCTADLSAGQHFLTFTAIDTDGFESAATVYFEVLAFADQDRDGDGWTGTEGDCDDNDPSVHPAAPEVENGADDDCDGATDEGTSVYDDDGDGQTEAGGDCDDGDAGVHLGAAETCDGVDQDCDHVVDEGTICYDDDGDGYTETDGDCDDDAFDAHPGGTETADGADEDCDGTIDEGTVAFDDDGDCACETAPCVGSISASCATVVGGDCDDAKAAVGPLSDEECNGVDDDCDGTSDEADAVDGAPWYADADGDGYGDPLAGTNACAVPSGFVADDQDCDDTDPDINPDTPWWLDADGDGHGNAFVTTHQCEEPTGFTDRADDCDDLDAGTHPGATETCNGDDDDCDGTTDESGAVGCSDFYFDFDGDGYGVSASYCLCAAAGYYRGANDEDCYDHNADANPGATAWHTTNRGDGSYDYDCDGSQTTEWTANYDCEVDWSGFSCDTYTSGWSSSDPSCGASGTWDSGCSASWFSCDYSGSSSRTQGCR